jgi:hypothetical protein
MNLGLALDWTDGRTAGMRMTILDHGFRRVLTDTSSDEEGPRYSRTSSGTWDPPLPK